MKPGGSCTRVRESIRTLQWLTNATKRGGKKHPVEASWQNTANKLGDHFRASNCWCDIQFEALKVCKTKLKSWMCSNSQWRTKVSKAEAGGRPRADVTVEGGSIQPS
jgi:hypothetical protein